MSSVVYYGILGVLIVAVIALVLVSIDSVFEKKHSKKKNGKRRRPLGENDVRVIKVSQKALMEFLYVSMADKQEQFFDIDPLDVSNIIDFDYENGKFIFCVYRSEDDEGNIIIPSDEIDLQQLMKTIPDTTTTLLADDRYRDYTKKELVKFSKKIKIK